MKSTILLFFIGLFLSATPFQCGNDKEYPLGSYNEALDDVNISVIPEQLEYTVGDTIWLSAEISEDDMLASAGLEGLTNGDGNFTFQIIKLKKAYEYLDGGASKFDLIYANGVKQDYDSNKYGSGIYRGINMNHLNKKYFFNFGLIPKEVGAFSFYIGTISIFYNNGPDGAHQFLHVNQHFLVNSNNKKVYEDLGYSDRMFVGNSTTNHRLSLTDSTAFFAFIVK